MTDKNQTDVTFNADKNRYEMTFQNEIVFASVHRVQDTVHILRVETPESLRGMGAAGTLMQKFMDVARKEHLTVVPQCSFAKTWAARHPEYNDVFKL